MLAIVLRAAADQHAPGAPFEGLQDSVRFQSAAAGGNQDLVFLADLKLVVLRSLKTWIAGIAAGKYDRLGIPILRIAEIRLNLIQEFVRIGAEAMLNGDTLRRTNIQAAAAALAFEPIGDDLPVDKLSRLVFTHANAIQATGA